MFSWGHPARHAARDIFQKRSDPRGWVRSFFRVKSLWGQAKNAKTPQHGAMPLTAPDCRDFRRFGGSLVSRAAPRIQDKIAESLFPESMAGIHPLRDGFGGRRGLPAYQRRRSCASAARRALPRQVPPLLFAATEGAARFRLPRAISPTTPRRKKTIRNCSELLSMGALGRWRRNKRWRNILFPLFCLPGLWYRKATPHSSQVRRIDDVSYTPAARKTGAT